RNSRGHLDDPRVTPQPIARALPAFDREEPLLRLFDAAHEARSLELRPSDLFGGLRGDVRLATESLTDQAPLEAADERGEEDHDRDPDRDGRDREKGLGAV